MQIDEIIKGAPEGATHYTSYELMATTAVFYFKYVGGELYRYCRICGEWNLDNTKKTLGFKNRIKPL